MFVMIVNESKVIAFKMAIANKTIYKRKKSTKTSSRRNVY